MTDAAERTIGLVGAVLTLVGYVIGASIFILPGELAADVGPGAFLAYLVAALVASLSCLIGAELGSTVPVSGALNVTASRVIAPVAGFAGVWVTLIAVAVGLALIGLGFADYVAYFAPGADRTTVALAVVAGCGLLNLTTVRLAVGAQAAMTMAFLVILFAFGLGGVAHARPELLDPMLPRGLGATLAAAVPAYFSYVGVMVIVELGGEIKNPRKTIPMSLLLSFLIVSLSYSLVAFAVPALVPWAELDRVAAPVALAASRFLPGWAAAVIAVGALLAAATSVNGVLLVHSRDVVAMGRARVFPPAFARRNRQGIPAGAVLLVTGLGLAAVLLGGTIREYAVMAVLSVMILQILATVSVLLLPSRLPAEHAAAGFRLRPRVRWVVSSLSLVSAAAFLGLGALESLRNAVLYGAAVVVGLVYYYVRRAHLGREGYSLDEVLRSGTTAEG